MPSRVIVSQGIIIHVCIPIQSLHPARDNAVRLREASQGGVVPSGVVEHESKVRGVGVLSRVGVVRGGDA